MSTPTFFSKVCKHAHSQDKLDELLGIVFRPHELEMFNNRLRILKRLQAGKTYDQIQEELGVGIDTIARMSGILNGSGDILKKLLADITMENDSGSELISDEDKKTFYMFGGSA